MGQRCDVPEAGAGTVRIGRRDDEEIGGSISEALSEDEDEGRFIVGSGFSGVESCFLMKRVDVDVGRELGTIGGGNSMFSAAFCESCRAKSEACHHSKNFSAKMLVGSNILRLASNLGYTLLAIFLGLNIEPPSPGLADPTFLG